MPVFRNPNMDVYNAKRFGVKGSGDDTDALIRAVEAAANDARKLYIPAGSYNVEAALTATDLFGSLYVYGDGMGATKLIHQGATAFAPAIFGNSDGQTGIGTPVLVTASVPRGSETITLASTTGLAAGDFLSLRDKAQPLYGNNVGDICNVEGEVVQIESVDSSTQITIYGSTAEAYTLVDDVTWTNDNIDVRKLTLRHGWTFHDFSIEDGSGNIPLSLRTRGFSVNQTYGMRIFNVGFKGLTNDAVRFENAVGFHFSGLISKDSDWDAHYMFHGRSGSSGVISGCTMFGGRHLFTTGDDDVDIPVRNVTIAQCLGVGQTAATFDTHDGGRGIVFDNCIADGHTDGNGAVGSYHGFQIRCKDAVLINPIVRGNCETGIKITRGATNCQVLGGTITDATDYGIDIDTAENVSIRGTRIIRAGLSSIRVDRNASYNVSMENLLISGVEMIGPTTNGIEMASAAVWRPGFRTEHIKSRGVTNKYVNVPWKGSYGSRTPAVAKFTTLDRRCLSASAHSLLTSGTMFMVGLEIDGGERLTKIGTLIAADAVTPTNFWYALYDENLAKLAVTADNGSAALTANQVKELTLATPIETTYFGWYYIGIVSVAGTPPQFRGIGMTNSINNLVPMLVGNSTAGLTNPASAPATAAALTGAANVPFAYVV